MLLGDLIETALSSVGVTSARVEEWVGSPCGCQERKQKLNALDAWARRVARGQVQRAGHYLAVIMGQSTRST